MSVYQSADLKQVPYPASGSGCSNSHFSTKGPGAPSAKQLESLLTSHPNTEN